MTKDELRKHCERTCNRYRSAYINGNFDKVDKTYEEHKLVLKLLEREESALKALEDVRAEIESDRRDSCRTDLTQDEIALVCDAGNLCFGYKMQGEDFYIFED